MLINQDFQNLFNGVSMPSFVTSSIYNIHNKTIRKKKSQTFKYASLLIPNGRTLLLTPRTLDSHAFYSTCQHLSISGGIMQHRAIQPFRCAQVKILRLALLAKAKKYDKPMQFDTRTAAGIAGGDSRYRPSVFETPDRICVGFTHQTLEEYHQMI